MRTPKELLEKADAILEFSTKNHNLEGQMWAASFAQAHVALALAIQAGEVMNRATHPELSVRTTT